MRQSNKKCSRVDQRYASFIIKIALTILQTVDIVKTLETVETIDTVKNVDTVDTAKKKDLKKYHSPTD